MGRAGLKVHLVSSSAKVAAGFNWALPTAFRRLARATRRFITAITDGVGLAMPMAVSNAATYGV